MDRKRKVLLVTTLCFLIASLTVVGVFNYRIIDKEYDKLTITKLDEVAFIIEDQEQINGIINQINTSPRKYNPQNGFRYDHTNLFGALTFEKGTEKKVIHFVIPNGHVLTKYWEIEANFEFAKDPNVNGRKKVLSPSF